MHGTPKYGDNFAHVDYASPDAPKGGTLREAAIGTFDTLNPYSLKGKAAKGLNLYYDRLMRRVWDEPFTMYPLIAERADVASDRSAVTFHLNPDAKFNDGSPITADDVLFSYKTMMEGGRPNMRRIYKLISKAEKIDDHTVHFEFSEGYDEETVMIIAMMPVLAKKWWEGRTFDSTALDIPLSSGPYKIKSFEAGRRITYERNPDYWAQDLPVNVGHYNFETITYDYFRDDTVAFEAFKAGDLNFRREWDISNWMSGYDFPAVEDGRVTKDPLAHQRPERVRAMIFNTRRAPFDDIRVRDALNLLFDFAWANKNLYYGEYERINSYFPNSSLAATGSASEAEKKLLAPYMNNLPADILGPVKTPPAATNEGEKRSNMRKAYKLLKDAGWVIKDGAMANAETGSPFKFELLLGAPEDEKLALLFTRNLQKVGIDATVRVMDAASYRGRLNDYDFDMTLYYWQNSLSPGTEQMLYWTCEAAEMPAQWNFAGICNPAVDALAKNIAESKTREELVNSVHALDRVLMAGTYMIPLYYAGKDYTAHAADIHRPDETPIYGMVIETWWSKATDKAQNTP